TGNSIDELKALAEGPRPEPKAAPPQIELLDKAPPQMTRPLALVEAHAYAATWCYVRITETESQNKNGTIIRHDPPRERFEKRLFVVRDDGVVFGDGGNFPMENLGLELELAEIPRIQKLLSAPGQSRSN
ncbi:MAG: hypothetical protein GY943_38935, partial [Chloroflexi bacterium]|nr:hypothetical protein [Chloroflexota bacterium]